MKICKRCDAEFPSWVKIDGKRRNLGNRSYCLECSPWGKHNTKTLTKDQGFKSDGCRNCGEATDGTHRSGWCKPCASRYDRERWVLKKILAVQYKGGECKKCGYNKHYSIMHFHHLDPSTKDYTWNKLRQKSWDDIKAELDKCSLLCSRCHGETHIEDHIYAALDLDGKTLEEIVAEGEFIFEHKPLKKIMAESLEKRLMVCPQCEKEFASKHCGGSYCSPDCSQLAQHRADRPSAEELQKMIDEMSWVAIGRKYKVSDNAIRKWARQYGLIE